MKYKKQIVTGALAISLLVGGSSVFAATVKDLGIKNTQSIYQKQNKNSKVKNEARNKIVGTITAINSTGSGFTIGIKNMKTKTTLPLDIKTNIRTIYSKDGLKATISDLAIGQKVIVVENLDKITNILVARTVKIVTNKKNL